MITLVSGQGAAKLWKSAGSVSGTRPLEGTGDVGHRPATHGLPPGAVCRSDTRAIGDAAIEGAGALIGKVFPMLALVAGTRIEEGVVLVWCVRCGRSRLRGPARRTLGREWRANGSEGHRPIKTSRGNDFRGRAEKNTLFLLQHTQCFKENSDERV